MFTLVYVCLPMYTHVYHGYHWLLMLVYVCLLIFTRVYLWLPLFSCVDPCLPLFIRFYLFTTVCYCMFTSGGHVFAIEKKYGDKG